VVCPIGISGTQPCSLRPFFALRLSLSLSVSLEEGQTGRARAGRLSRAAQRARRVSAYRKRTRYSGVDRSGFRMSRCGKGELPRGREGRGSTRIDEEAEFQMSSGVNRRDSVACEPRHRHFHKWQMNDRAVRAYFMATLRVSARPLRHYYTPT